MSFSDLVHTIERDVRVVLLPAGLPSDTREAEALARDAEGIAVTLDPELEPIFVAIGAAGNAVEAALHELGSHVGHLKSKLATRAAAPVGLPPLAPAGAVPMGAPDPAAGPQPTVNDLQAQANQAALERQVADPNPLDTAAPPAGAADPSTEATPSSVPTPGTADPAGPNPVEPDVPAVPTPDPALSTAEADFAGLSSDDRTAFEAAEGLEDVPPAAP